MKNKIPRKDRWFIFNHKPLPVQECIHWLNKELPKWDTKIGLVMIDNLPKEWVSAILEAKILAQEELIKHKNGFAKVVLVGNTIITKFDVLVKDSIDQFPDISIPS